MSAVEQPSAYRAAKAAAGLSLAASGLTGLWRMLNKGLFGSYRPDLHYMRGPGPKWRQKHGCGALVDDRTGSATRSREVTRLTFEVRDVVHNRNRQALPSPKGECP
jgi:hypothetical protein